MVMIWEDLRQGWNLETRISFVSWGSCRIGRLSKGNVQEDLTPKEAEGLDTNQSQPLLHSSC